MANTLTNVMYRILANALPILRESAWAPQLVSRDFQPFVAEQGETIDATVYPESTPYQISPSHNPLQPQDVTPTRVSVTLDQWWGDNFHLTDKEMAEVANNAAFRPRQLETKVRGLANKINTSVLAEYVNFYNLVGSKTSSAFDTPFSNSTDRTATKDATQVAARLTQELAPIGNRFCLLGENEVAEATALPQFSHADKRGNNNVVEDAVVGNQYGLLWLQEHQLPTHTAGTAAGATVTAIDANLAGDKTVTLDVSASTETLVKGDVLTFANHTQQYVVTADATLDTTGVAVSLEPGLAEAVDGSGSAVSVTVEPSHKVNFAAHRDAVVLATRLLSQDTGNPTAVMTDDVTGITMRLEQVRQRKQLMWEIDALWGVSTFRNQFGVRLAGAV